MGKTIDFETDNKFKLKLVRKWLKKELRGEWTEKQLNDLIINTLLRQYESSGFIITTIKEYWRNNNNDNNAKN